jgi:hypothetical protein
MNLFVTGAPDSAQSLAWMSEIRAGIDTVANPKSATALQAAGVEIDALLTLMTPAGQAAPIGGVSAA